MIYWSQIVKKNSPFDVKNLIESRKIQFSMASTLFSLIDFEFADFDFFYSLDSRKILSGPISL